MAHIVVIDHETPVDTDDGVRHLTERGFAIRHYRPDQGEPLPAVDDRIAGIIVTGGPQYVSDLDRFPYLRDEMAFIGDAMAAGTPLLGICLGAQLVAAELGAKVDFDPDGHVAFGYYPLHVTDAGRTWLPNDLMVLAANAQGFSLPAGATLLAAGEPFPNQAFSYGETTIALQFHPEVTCLILNHWQRVLAGNIGKPGTQSLAEQDSGFARYNKRLTEWYCLFLDRFFKTP